MNKKEIILAAFAEIPSLVEGPHFDFQPYNYGPFDKNIYAELMGLFSEGCVDVIPENTWLSYRLTEKGQELADKILGSFQEKAQKYIKVISEFVRSLPFEQLVTAIYKAYPEMKENSVFQSVCQ